MTYSSGRGDKECAALRVCIEGGQSSFEQVETALDVDIPALKDLLTKRSEAGKGRQSPYPSLHRSLHPDRRNWSSLSIPASII